MIGPQISDMWLVLRHNQQKVSTIKINVNNEQSYRESNLNDVFLNLHLSVWFCMSSFTHQKYTKTKMGLQCKTLLRLKIWSKLYKVRFIVTLGPYWNPSKLQFLLVLTKKQDFSLKCLAWKGFIPCLRWKSPVSKSPKNYWSKKKSWVWKNYGFKMNFHFKCLCTSFLKFIALYFSYQSEHMYVFHLSKSVYFLM